MIIRIKRQDFSNFAGYTGDKKTNEELNKYINLYNNNPEIKYFQIESSYNDMDIQLIAYICEKAEGKFFFRTEFPLDGNPKETRYFLCFAKEEKDSESHKDTSDEKEMSPEFKEFCNGQLGCASCPIGKNKSINMVVRQDCYKTYEKHYKKEESEENK